MWIHRERKQLYIIEVEGDISIIFRAKSFCLSAKFIVTAYFTLENYKWLFASQLTEKPAYITEFSFLFESALGAILELFCFLWESHKRFNDITTLSICTTQFRWVNAFSKHNVSALWMRILFGVRYWHCHFRHLLKAKNNRSKITETSNFTLERTYISECVMHVRFCVSFFRSYSIKLELWYLLVCLTVC